MSSPDRRRAAVAQVQDVLGVSERRACRVIGQPRSTQRYEKRSADDEEQLRMRIVDLASQYGRYPVPSAQSSVNCTGYWTGWLSAGRSPAPIRRLADQSQTS